MITHEEYKSALDVVNKYSEQMIHYKYSHRMDEVSKYGKPIKELCLYELDISVRLLNVLQYNSDKIGFGIDKGWEFKIGDFEKVSMKTLLSCRNFGAKSKFELEGVLSAAGIKMLP